MPFLFIPHGCPAYLKYALLMGTGSIITAVPFRVTILGQDHLHSSLKKIKEKNFNAEPYRDALSSKLTIQTYILQFLNFQLAISQPKQNWILIYAFHANIVKKT